MEDCTFRMLTPAEIANGMAFAHGHKVKGSNRAKVKGCYGIRRLRRVWLNLRRRRRP